MSEGSAVFLRRQGPLSAGLALSILFHVVLAIPSRLDAIAFDTSLPALKARITIAAPSRNDQLPPTIRQSMESDPKQADAHLPLGRSVASHTQSTSKESDDIAQDPATPPSAPSTVASLTGDDLRVWELFPEQLTEFVLLADATTYWHDIHTLRKRPLVIGNFMLSLPSEYLIANAGERAVIAIRIQADGQLHGIELLTHATLFSEALISSLENLRFLPGELVAGPVDSVMYLDLRLP